MYNQEKFKDLAKLVCPPYDIISPAESNYYHDISPYNFVHLELGKKVPGEINTDGQKIILRIG